MKFTVIIERDEDGYYVASAPDLLGCPTRSKDLKELTDRIKETINLNRSNKQKEKWRYVYWKLLK